MPDFSLPHSHGAHRHEKEVRRVLADDARFSAAAELFRSLGDPTRVRIFWLLSHREECVINIAAILNMSSPAVSHHLRSLTESGLLESRRDGKEVYYRAPDTVQGQLLHKLEIFEPLKAMIADGLPVLATCAGLILLAEHLDGDATTHLAALPVCVKRNAYGRQLSSFTTTADVGDIADYPLVFIRAPYISAAGENVQTLAKVDGNIVAVRYQNQIGLAFHPELTDDTRIHASFLKLVEQRLSKQ